MNQYGMILSMLAALFTLSTFVASWFDDECDKDKKAKSFSRKLQRAVNPFGYGVYFPAACRVRGGSFAWLPRYSNAESAEHGAESVAAGVITILSCLTAYMTVDPAEGDSVRFVRTAVKAGSQSSLTTWSARHARTICSHVC